MTAKGTAKTAKSSTARKKTLVIVESPSKAKTIGKYLGSSYKVTASVGHVRDLPKSKIGIDIENDFEPEYIAIRGKGDVIKELRKEAKQAGKIYLATGVPIMFGVITTENIEQAIARAGSKSGNKGYDCALSAIETVNLLKQM